MSYRFVLKKKLTINTIMVLFLGVLFMLTGISSYYSNGHSLAAATIKATSHQPEKYSELYFINPKTFPTYAPTNRPQSITFGITNHQAQVFTYRYTVTVRIGAKESISYGSVMVSDGNATYQTINFTVPTPNTKASITVSINPSQEILFRSTS